jgi:outer membrane protein assembly factor BamB
MRRLPLLPVEEAWLVTLAAAPLAGGAMDADRVYIPLGPRRVDAVLQPGSEQVVALDRQTGEQRWARDLASPWPPVATHGRVFLAARDGIHALDATTGTSVWHVQLAGTLVAAPAAGDGLLVVMTTAEGLLALRAEDGAAAWQLPLGVSDGPAALIVDTDAVYLSFDANVVRASLRDGSRMWAQKLSGTLGPPAIARDRVFVGSTDNYLYALDADDGDFEWRYPAGADVIGAAAKGDTVFFVALDNVLRALNRGSGNQRWKSLLQTRASAPPRVFDGIVLVPGLTPALATFALDTGAPLGMYTAASDLIGAALVDADLKPFRVAIVSITGEGRVAGLRPAEMTFREPPPVPLQELPGTALGPDQFPAPRQP